VTQEIPLTSLQADSANIGNRIFFIDLLKAISISSVVFYHAVFFPIATYYAVAIPELILVSPLRFCIPVLLTISFFLFERELSKPIVQSNWAICKKRLIRIAIPTGFWFGLATLIHLFKGSSLPEIIQEVLTGTIYLGSYFLLILLQLTPVYILVRSFFKSTRNILIIIFLQVIVFIIIKSFTFYGGAFGKTAIATLASIERPFCIYWFAYMAIGYFLYHRLTALMNLSSSLPTVLKVLMICITAIWIVCEYANLIPNIGSHFYVFEYAFIACIASVFAAFISTASIQEKQLPRIFATLVRFLSKYSLGIFCVNGILSQGFSRLGQRLFDGMTFNFLEVFTARIIGFLILITASLLISICLKRLGLKACVI
jgi:Acyltransferase family